VSPDGDAHTPAARGYPGSAALGAAAPRSEPGVEGASNASPERERSDPRARATRAPSGSAATPEREQREPRAGAQRP
jgi:hypothetical protein